MITYIKETREAARYLLEYLKARQSNEVHVHWAESEPAKFHSALESVTSYCLSRIEASMEEAA